MSFSPSLFLMGLLNLFGVDMDGGEILKLVMGSPLAALVANGEFEDMVTLELNVKGRQAHLGFRSGVRTLVEVFMDADGIQYTYQGKTEKLTANQAVERVITDLSKELV